MFKTRKKIFLTTLISLIGLLIGALSVSLTWFAKMNTMDVNISGSVLSQYFDSGEGTEQDPFVITRPKHWENLVWLHNNVSGFFQGIRDENNGEGEGNQQQSPTPFYFQVGKLNEDLNDGVYYVYDYNADGTIRNNTLTSKTLVLTTNNYLIPIGCSTKPFIGEINGNGITITGFHVLGFEDKDMDGTQDSGEEGFCDVGIFGYIGENSSIHDIYFDNFTIHLASADPNPHDRGNDPNWHNNSHHDLTGGANDSPDGTPETVYAGYIAGHVRSSSSIEDVYINNCSIVSGSSATVGFGFFGAVENQQGAIMSTPLSDIEEIKQAGDAANFGGSIDFLTVFQRLSNIFSHSSATTYADVETIVNTVVTPDDPTTPDIDESVITTEDLQDSMYHHEKTVTGWGTYNSTLIGYNYADLEDTGGGMYNFPDDNSTYSASGSGRLFQCLYGESVSHYSKSVTTYTYSGSGYDCIFIHTGDNYLCHRYYPDIRNCTDSDHAAGWRFDESNHLYTYIFDVKYYLNRNNASLELGSSATTTWTQTNDDSIYTIVNGGEYYLDYDNGWCLSPYADRYLINDGNNHYINASSGTITSTTNEDDATNWFMTNASGNTAIGFMYNGAPLYLVNDNETLSLSTTPTTWTKDGTHYYVTVQGTKFYLTFENNVWALRPESAVRLSYSGSNYLHSTDNSTLSNLTNANTVYWQFTSNSGDTQIYYIANGQKNYLCCNGELYVATSGTTTWHRNGNGIYCTIGTIDYYLTFDNGWRVTDLEFYTIHDSDGNYLVANGTNSFSNTTSSSDATHFYFSDTTGTYPIGTINYVFNGTIYYLNAPVNNNSASLQSGASGITSWSNDGNAIYFQNGTNTFYLDYDNQWIVKKIYQGYCITDGTNYLTVSGTTIGNVTNINNATFFEFSNTTGDPSGTIKAIGTNYYLRNYNNGTLQSSTTSTSWSNDGSNIYNGNYYLVYSSNAWRLLSYREGYYISKDGYYMNLSGTTITAGTTPSTLWSGLSGQIKAQGTQYYLYNNVREDSLSGSTTQNGGNWVNSGNDESGILYWHTGSYTQYIIRSGTGNNGFKTGYNSGSNVQLPDSSYALNFTHVVFGSEAKAFSKKNIISSLTQVTMPNITVTQYNANKNGTSTYSHTKDYSSIVSQAHLQECQKSFQSSVKGGNSTYFPLRVAANDIENPNITNNNYTQMYAASEKNTGYIISGAHCEDSANTDDNQKMFGDIRISGWEIGAIETSYKNNAFTSGDGNTAGGIYTVDDSNSRNARKLTSTEQADANYQKRKTQLGNTLSGKSRVFGIHFMDAAISPSNTIRAKTATLLGTTYNNYQLPEDSIDFHVNQRGDISFFAGEYYGGNNAFFSLHKIFRNNKNEITAIKEIEEVYAHSIRPKNMEYIFKFSDDTYTNIDGSYTGATTIDTNYNPTPVFKTIWIKRPNDLSDSSKRLFYFSIPCNAGEYALGSVSGRTGAYLVYLDIAANGGDSVLQWMKDPVDAHVFDADFRSPSDVSPHCIIQLGAEFPTVSSNYTNLQVTVTFKKPSELEQGDDYLSYYPTGGGIYIIHVTNKTNQMFKLSVMLIDDDNNLYNDYTYAYRIVYTNNSYTDTVYNGETVWDGQKTEVDFWQRMAIFDIPGSGACVEDDYGLNNNQNS